MNEHYNKPIPPIHYIMANNLDFCEGNIVKYVSRHKQKNGDEDIVKAIHYALFILKNAYEISTEDIVSKINKIIAKL